MRRVWDHKADSGHDPYGEFTVEITSSKHPITNNFYKFETIDELYFRQAGDAPIHPLATAHSKVTGKDEPMAWAYEVGDGRVFQTLLGHSSDSIHHAANLIQRGCTWAAGRSPLTFDPPKSITKTTIFRNGSQWKP